MQKLAYRQVHNLQGLIRLQALMPPPGPGESVHHLFVVQSLSLGSGNFVDFMPLPLSFNTTATDLVSVRGDVHQ